MRINPARRLVAFLIWPPSRLLAAGLLWSHRHTLTLWGRSLAAESRRRPFDPQRASTLVRTLWKVSTDQRLQGVGGIDLVTVDSVVAGQGSAERAATVRATLLDVPGVVSVEVDGVAVEPILIRAPHTAA